MSELFAALIGAVVGGLITANVSRSLLHESVALARRERAAEQRERSWSMIAMLRNELLLNIELLSDRQAYEFAELSVSSLHAAREHVYVASEAAQSAIRKAEMEVYQYNALVRILRDREGNVSYAVHTMRARIDSVAVAAMRALREAVDLLQPASDMKGVQL